VPLEDVFSSVTVKKHWLTGQQGRQYNPQSERVPLSSGEESAATCTASLEARVPVLRALALYGAQSKRKQEFKEKTATVLQVRVQAARHQEKPAPQCPA
jgi:hypothetical protein